MAGLLSVNGELKSLYFQPGSGQKRSKGYKQVQIGQPLMVRFLYFSVKWGDGTKQGQRLMISSFVKTKEEKRPVAEAINYFNPKARFRNGRFELEDIGGEHYGHELCYYTKSYLGETLRITTKIMELDGVGKNVMQAITDGIGAVAGLPTFAPFVWYAGLAASGVKLVEKIVKIFDRDDVILPGYSLDLHFKTNHERVLQSGRIVCVPGVDDENHLIRDYELTPGSRLVAKANGQEYGSGTYFVLQVDSRENKRYDNFHHFQDAAELLAMTNRGGNPREYIDAVLGVFEASGEIHSIRRIERLASDAKNYEAREMARALLKHLSPDVRKVYEPRVNDLFPAPSRPGRGAS
jgi:hypothetical protein